MKTTICLIALLCTGFLTNAQDLPTDENGNVVFTEVVEVSGKSAAELMENAKAWFDEYYMSDKNRVIEGETILDNHNFKTTKGNKDAGAVNYEIRVIVKDGRYKYEISNLVHKDYANDVGTGGKLEREEPKDGFSQKIWEDIKAQAKQQAEEAIKSLKAAMTKTPEKKNDDW